MTDIEDTDILNNLPMIPESAEETDTAQQNEKFEILSPAKLNHVAASVTNAVPPEVLQKKGKPFRFQIRQKPAHFCCSTLASHRKPAAFPQLTYCFFSLIRHKFLDFW